MVQGDDCGNMGATVGEETLYFSIVPVNDFAQQVLSFKALRMTHFFSIKIPRLLCCSKNGKG